MRFASALACALVLSVVACDQVEKAIDANNNQPGEADGRAQELGTVPARLSALGYDDKDLVVVAQNGDVLTRPREGSGALQRIGGLKREAPIYREWAAVDASYIWVAGEGGLFRMPRAGGDAEKAPVAIDRGGLAMNADSVFVVAADHKRILKVDKKTLAGTDLATGFRTITEMVQDGDKIDVADREADTISAVPMGGGATVVLAKDQAHPEYIGVGPEHVYWVNGALSDHKEIEDRLMRVKKEGGAVEPLAAQTGGFSGPIVADGQFAYLGRAGYGLFRAPVSGGEGTKFVNTAVVDFFLTTDKVVSIENNGFRFSDDERKKPNRILVTAK